MTWEEVIGVLIIWVIILWVTPLGHVLWAMVVKSWKDRQSRKQFDIDNPGWREELKKYE